MASQKGGGAPSTTRFGLLRDGRIHPVVTATYLLADAVQACHALESGKVVGNIVLIADPEHVRTDTTPK